MNYDFIESTIVKIIIAGGTYWATKNGFSVDGSTLQMFAGSLVAAGAAAYRLYKGYAMTKVPSTNVQVAK